MFRVIVLLGSSALLHAGLAGQAGSLVGRLLCDGAPVPHAHVVLEGGSGTVSDAGGGFRLEGLRPGPHTLRVSAVGFEPLARTVDVPADGTGRLGDLLLRRAVGELAEVVVSSSLREVSRAESPVPVEVVSPALFRRNPAPALFDAVGMVNGVRPQVNCSVCNAGDIHINGLEGPYTLVLIDGMPIVSGLGTVYGLSGIPMALVERVEVVKGPGSALYGSEAMGGIINVITKDPVLAPRLAVDAMGTTWSEWSADAGFAKRTGHVAFLSGFSVFHYGLPRDGNGDGFTDMTLQERVSLFQRIAVQRPGRKAASLAARYVHEDRWGGQMRWTPDLAGSDSIYGEAIATRRWELIGTYALPVRERITLQTSWNRHQQESWYGTMPYDAVQGILFAQLLWDRRIGTRHHVLSGLAYRYTHYNDNTPATSSGTEPFARDRPHRKPLPGIFVQDEWRFADGHMLLVGHRTDLDADHGLVHSPRLAWKFAPNGRFAVRANFGSGHRVVNLFTEEHAALTGAREVVVAEDLLPERSWNGTLNLVRRWPGERRSLVLDGSLFLTRFGNRILPDYGDPQRIVYANLDGHGISRGASLNAEARAGDAWRLLAGASCMEVFTENGGHREEQYFAPAWSGTFVLAWERPGGFGIDLTGQWYGPMRLPVQPNDFRPERSPWYALVNVQARQRIGERFELYGGLRNLLDFVPQDPLMRPFDPFDRTADDPVANPHGHTFDTAYMYAPLQGRRGFLGLRYTLR